MSQRLKKLSWRSWTSLIGIMLSSISVKLMAKCNPWIFKLKIEKFIAFTLWRLHHWRNTIDGSIIPQDSPHPVGVIKISSTRKFKSNNQGKENISGKKSSITRKKKSNNLWEWPQQNYKWIFNGLDCAIDLEPTFNPSAKKLKKPKIFKPSTLILLIVFWKFWMKSYNTLKRETLRQYSQPARAKPAQS